MSTKSTILYNDDFHLYTEIYDDEFVYLQLANKELLTVDSTGITVAIPNYIWESIKNSITFDTSLADATDDDLLTLITKDVNDRIEEYKKTNDTRRGFIGCLAYGSVTNPFNVQIENGLKYWKNVRNHHNLLRNKILKVLKENSK